MDVVNVLLDAKQLEISVAIALLISDEVESDNSLKIVLQIALMEGRIGLCKKITEYLGRDISNYGLEIAFLKCLNDEHFEDAEMAANMMTEPERNNFLGVTLNRYLEKNLFNEAQKIIGSMEGKKSQEVLNDHFYFLCREQSFKNSHLVANLMTEPDRSESLKKSLRGFVRMGNIYGAKETAALLEQKLKNKDAKNIFEKVLKAGKLQEATDSAVVVTGPYKYVLLGAVMEQYVLKNKLDKARDVAILIID